jgi:hypothetical protein
MDSISEAIFEVDLVSTGHGYAICDNNHPEFLWERIPKAENGSALFSFGEAR